MGYPALLQHYAVSTLRVLCCQAWPLFNIARHIPTSPLTHPSLLFCWLPLYFLRTSHPDSVSGPYPPSTHSVTVPPWPLTAEEYTT
ncbi:hypothetical protein BGZ61DRAFT_437023 [Ilyonectria robusta]|uniref:uncharacterized protein n=1 Tax=Ilyonectria robusta TaxID=1079257 RepID=UPI001E8E9848|nr:uncharacterized protein BGZ61DRAFT_437023 [Ilyonectria robusta]KAH8736781.1 hypothetical protein BGZ61DRAFT_437023 [Ilyonectria robusta]